MLLGKLSEKPNTLKRFNGSLLFVILVLNISLNWSCRKLVQDEFPDFDPVPVVNGILVADSTLKIHVSLAGKIDSNRLPYVENAAVTLYIDNNVTGFMEYDTAGFYTSATLVQPETIYKCIVEIPGFEPVICENHVPPPPEIIETEFIVDGGRNRDGMNYSTALVTFKNSPDKNLYFEVRFREYYSSSFYYTYFVEVDDPVLLNEGTSEFVFSNELISGDSYQLKLNIPDPSGSTGMVELRQTSKDYYKYVKNLYLYEAGRYPEIVGGVVTANPLYSNVENGYGIFAGYSYSYSEKLRIFP